jgi:hypothetical protein
MTIDQQFTTLTEKLQVLLKQQQRMHKENERLRGELAEAARREQECHQRMEQLEQQITILKLGNAALPEQDRKEFEKKINQYIREIDKCIAFLSQ